MTKKEIVKALNEDVKGEHAAIIQYLIHAYKMGEGEIACEIEAIAREEMRHFDWLAETIVSLGGKPTIERGKMRLGNRSVANWMRNDVTAEEEAITLYKEHIKAVTDPKIKRLLQRILSDEEAHHTKFTHLVEKVKKESIHSKAGVRQDQIAKMLNWGTEHEYTVILQYLLHSYMTPDEEIKKELQDQAINEMQHLGWLAEELVAKEGTPRIEHTEIDQSAKTPDMLKADIAVERVVTAEYTKQSQKVKDPELRQLLKRIRDHEIYHDEVFGDLLKKLKSK